MKRKKPPIALISFLVVSLLGLVIYSKSFGVYNLSAEEQMKLQQQEAMEQQKQRAEKEPAAKVDAGKEVDAMHNAMKNSGKPAKAPGAVHGGPEDAVGGGMASVPTVLMPSDEVRKPVPNSSSPSSQWYGDK